jgi:hypothetical protein
VKECRLLGCSITSTARPLPTNDFTALGEAIRRGSARFKAAVIKAALIKAALIKAALNGPR